MKEKEYSLTWEMEHVVLGSHNDRAKYRQQPSLQCALRLWKKQKKQEEYLNANCKPLQEEIQTLQWQEYKQKLAARRSGNKFEEWK